MGYVQQNILKHLIFQFLQLNQGQVCMLLPVVFFFLQDSSKDQTKASDDTEMMFMRSWLIFREVGQMERGLTAAFWTWLLSQSMNVLS